MKYIDAEKLTRFEETLTDIIVSSQGLCTYEACKDMAKREAPFLITSLQQEQPEVDLEKAARHVYESWMGGTMYDVRRDMVELGKVLNIRKEE